MSAIHWLRSRQEEREWAYWWALVGYNPRDHSLNNRIYLVYLIIFLTAWTFITLTLFAAAGTRIITFLNPVEPVRAAIFLEFLLLGFWFFYNTFQALKRSPVCFSEPDAELLCQNPVDHRFLTIRWMLMPWLKSAIPFWLSALTLGFSLAGTALPGLSSANDFLGYAWFGLRAWIVIIPIHLALYALQLIVGVVRLQKDREVRWFGYLVLAGMGILFMFQVISFMAAHTSILGSIYKIVETTPYLLSPGFTAGGFIPSYLISWILTIGLLGFLFWISAAFNLTRAAQETKGSELLDAARRYGFTTYAENLQTQQRLVGTRNASRLPASSGVRVLLWKDMLQVLRTFKLSSVFLWLNIALFMVILPLIPDSFSRLFLIAIWAIQIGQVTVIRLRTDFSHWALIRQLPFAHKDFILLELSSASVASIIISALGLIVGSILSKTPPGGLLLILPGIITVIAGMSARDVIRRSRSDLLLVESVTGVSEGGILLGLFLALIPILILNQSSGAAGLISAILLSIGLGGFSAYLAAKSFPHIDAP
jgi:hypothetical protein